MTISYRELAEAIALTRGASRQIDDDPGLARRRLDELERLLEDLMARLEGAPGMTSRAREPA